MKTNKEYPATHSMSTAWFAADEDGNVAIFDFNENGPVPQVAQAENVFESILSCEFAEEPINNGLLIPSVNFSDEQISELCDNYLDEDLSRYKIGDSISNCYIKIKENRVNDFFEEMNNQGIFDSEFFEYDIYLCLSKERGVFYVENGSIEVTENLIDIVDRIGNANEFLIFDMFDEHTNDVCFDPILPYMPFYVFAQPYSNQYAIQRIFEPNFPFKITQLPTKTQDSIVRLPIKFSEHSRLQISDYLPTNARIDFDNEIIPFEVFQNKRFGFRYARFANEKVGTSYYLLSSVINTINYEMYYPESQASYTPTIFVIDENNYYFWKDDYGFIPNYVFLPILRIEHFSEQKFSDFSSDDKIRFFSKSYIEDNIRFFNPYVILIKDEIKFVLEHYYKLDNHQITINDQPFPYFLFSEMESHREEIMDYANREYRGIKIPIKLTENELQKLKTSVD